MEKQSRQLLEDTMDYDDLHLWLADLTGALLCLAIPAMVWLMVAL